MGGQLRNHTDEIKRLRRCVNDLVSVLALPATWSGCEPSQIVRSVLDVLLGMVNLDLVYIRLGAPSVESPPVEMVWFAQSRSAAVKPREIRELLNQCLGSDSQAWPPLARMRIAGEDISIAPFRLGLQGEGGLIIAGSQRPDFPQQTERLIISVAANQAAIWLQEVRLLSEQKRVAKELDERVAQRTSELAAAHEAHTAELQKANDALTAEVAERSNAERAVRENQRLLHAIINNSSAIIFVKDIEGRYLLVNRQFEKVFRCLATDIIGKDDYHFFPKEQADMLRKFDCQVMQSDTTLEKEETLSLNGGTHAYIAIKSALRDADGAVCGLCGIATDITARKGVERALRQSEEQYRVVVETANEAVVSIDEASRILFANSATATIFGYSVPELIGQPLMVLMAESFRPRHQRAIGRYLENGKRHMDWRGVEVMGRRKSGEEFPVEVSFGEVVRDGHHVFTGCIRDITERKKAEANQAAQARHTGLRADVSAAFAEADDLKTILNSCVEAVVHHLDAAFARIWTLDKDESVLVLQASAGLYTRLDGTHARVPVGQLKIGRIAEERRPHLTNDVPNDERVNDRDWARREGMVAFAGYPLVVEGRIVGVIAMFARRSLDQTVLASLESVAEVIAQGIYRKDADDKLRRSEAYLAEAQKLSRTGSFGWNISTDEHFWSEETFRIFQYESSAKLTLQRVLERIHPEDKPAVKQILERAAQDRKDWEHEYRLSLPDGSVKQVHVVAHATGSKSGDPDFVGAVMDVTEARHAEEALRRGQADLAHVSRVTTLGEFTASIAHEVNQPLTAVTNNASACLGLLADAAPALQDVREALGEIIEDAERASAVIARVRQLARKAPPDKALLDMKNVVADVLVLARSEITTRRVIITTEWSERLPPVFGDRVEFQQVLLNLIVNGMDAMKATEESKRILAISGRPEIIDGKAMCLLKIKDSGVGFEPGEKDKLFQAFYTTKPGGMGMGLAISRSILEAHGGRLWAEPNQEAGASFFFSLPAAPTGTL